MHLGRPVGAALLGWCICMAMAHPIEQPVGANTLVARQQSTGQGPTASPTEAPKASPTPSETRPQPSVETSSSTTPTQGPTSTTSSRPVSSPTVSSSTSITPSTTATSPTVTSTITTSLSSTTQPPDTLTTPPATTEPPLPTAPTNTTSSAAGTSRSSNVFSSSNPNFRYAVGGTVVASFFAFIIFVLLIRCVVQSCTRKPPVSPPTTRSSPRTLQRKRNDTRPAPAPQSIPHKGSLVELNESQRFLSSDSVALYPITPYDRDPTRYSDQEPRYYRRRSQSGSSTGHSTSPFISRRPASMSFLDRPSATYPAFTVEPASEFGEAQRDLRSVPEGSVIPPGPRPNPPMVRTNYNVPYRQYTLTPSPTSLSRGPSALSASVYSQYSHHSATPPPPVPGIPAQYVQRTLSPDVSAALSTMRAYSESGHSALAFPPTEEDTAPANEVMRRSSRLPLDSPTATHGRDVYFG